MSQRSNNAPVTVPAITPGMLAIDADGELWTPIACEQHALSGEGYTPSCDACRETARLTREHIRAALVGRGREVGSP